MKKIISILLSFLMLFMISGCKSEAEKSLETLRQQVSGEIVIQVAFMGYYQESLEDVYTQLENKGVFETFPFMKELTNNQMLDYEGDEVYLIVPSNVKAQINIYENDIDFETGINKKGKLIFSVTDGQPVLFSANISDVYSNVIVEVIESDGFTFDYIPSISLKDGTLNTRGYENTIKDISIYNFVE